VAVADNYFFIPCCRYDCREVSVLVRVRIVVLSGTSSDDSRMSIVEIMIYCSFYPLLKVNKGTYLNKTLWTGEIEESLVSLDRKELLSSLKAQGGLGYLLRLGDHFASTK
jgi:hypothetical protein